MTKKEICKNSLSTAFSYAFKGFEVKSIIHENSNEIYAVSDILTDREKYHKLRIYTNAKGQYVRLYGRVFYLETLSNCNRFSVLYTQNGGYPLWITAVSL